MKGLISNVVAIIPARGGSKRLPRKNLFPILGVPMIVHAIVACKESKFISKVYVSSEDKEILEVGANSGAEPLERPRFLAGDHVLKMDAIRDAVNQLKARNVFPSLIVSVQANSPEVSAEVLDNGIDHLVAYDRNEVLSVDSLLNQNGAFRIMRPDAVFRDGLSIHLGVVVTDIIDIHTREDIETLLRRHSRE